MTRESVVLVCIALLGCTRPNPDYCDEERPCAEGRCNLQTHYCEPDVDAVVDACEQAGGTLVFATERDGDSEIARVLADGTGYVALTENSVVDTDPRWSPSGGRIAWVNGGQIYVMNADGTDQQNVSAGSGFAPRWSPDGVSLLFTSFRDGNNEVYSVNWDGTNLQNLTMNAASDAAAAWSASGARVVFESTRYDEAVDILIMNSDGFNPTTLVAVDGTAERFVGWAPSDDHIAWVAANQLWVGSPTAASPLAIGSATADESWSKDGQRIVATVGNDIVVFDADGTSDDNVTNHVASDGTAVWSPDGQRIAFVSDRDGDEEVYVIGAEGGDAHNVTDDPFVDALGDWAPCEGSE